MSKISRFTSKAVTMAKNVLWSRRSRNPRGGDGFADYTLLSLHYLRIYLNESYLNALGLLNEIPHICGEIVLKEDVIDAG